jgi:hypothetical protein
MLFFPRENIGKNNLLFRSSYKKNLIIKVNELSQNWLAAQLPCFRAHNHNSELKDEFHSSLGTF